MLYLLVIIIAFFSWVLPLPGKIILLVINIFIPDPLPFLDEIIQGIGILKKIRAISRYY